MTTDEHGKCTKCGQYDLKGFAQDGLIYVYCPHCCKLKVVEREANHE